VNSVRSEGFGSAGPTITAIDSCATWTPSVTLLGPLECRNGAPSEHQEGSGAANSAQNEPVKANSVPDKAVKDKFTEDQFS